jgi:HK97 family phage prohead protease
MAPYYINDDNAECSGWAVEKEDGEVMGCHTTKQDAIDQAVAIARAEDSEFIGERAMPGTLSPGDFVTWKENGETYNGRIREIVSAGLINIPGSGVQVEGTYFDPAAMVQMWEQDEDGWRESSTFLGLKFSQLSRINALPDAGLPEFSFEDEDDSVDDAGDTDEMHDVSADDVRQVNLTPPAYMRAAARQGLKYYDEGYAGDGLVGRTVTEARAMAEGNVTADKWVRLAAWIARHLVDLDAPAAQPGNEDYPSAGVVAHLLWGSGPSKRAAQRALTYAEGVVARLEEENRTLVSVEAKDMAKIETRTNTTQFEVRELEGGDGMTFTGYAAVFNSPSAPLPFTERIKPGAFKRSLNARNDIKMLWNHDTGTILGSTRAGTLTLEEDSVGLRVTANLPDTQAGRDAAYLIRRGDVDSMSFGFSVPKDGDEWISESERVLNSVRLHEISVVAFPAYPGTAGHTSVRGLDKVAKRAMVDADTLADAMLKIESGADLTEDEAEMLSKVIDTLAPKSEDEIDETKDDSIDPSMLELKKKKLQALMNGI